MSEKENEIGELGTPVPARKKRGFAVMDPALVREIAKRGGQAAHEKGTAHEFTSEEARAAGRKGGLTTHRKMREARERKEKPGVP